ncbi:hypothetical protein L6164_012451 [Bauhinia variegata]|uniref:Uncharacterized protein n=1 Tax=Bauhinia variegata TaxID=167791 RepID=A0ACB9PBM1_BAUVA|nr:hypothetical protein L6164_012451 [Bauhinia variegata]
MAKLSTAMDSRFWDFNVASPQTLDGTVKAVPGDPFPLDGTVASRALRVQQMSFLGNGFPLGIIPSYSPTPQKELGSFSLQTLLLKATSRRWWLALVGQFRPKKLIADIKNEISKADELELSIFKDVGKHLIDKSHYSLGLFSQFSPTPSTSMLVCTEGHGEQKRFRHKMMLFHKLPAHDLTLEAAWPQLFIDQKGKYWDVPESISLDLSSLVSDTGLRYRFGIHKNGGDPQAVNGIDGNPPPSLMPGLCAKAAFSFEKIRYFWRDEQAIENLKRRRTYQPVEGPIPPPPYDLRLAEPQSAISGIIGGNCAAWIWNGGKHHGVESREDLEISRRSKRSPFSADLFGSVCYTFQHGKFRNDFGDLTRLDARLDICSASAIAKKVLNGLKSHTADTGEHPLSSPQLNLIFQQQVAGPIVFRTDSKFSLGSSSGRHEKARAGGTETERPEQRQRELIQKKEFIFQILRIAMEEQFILRVPPSVAERIESLLNESSSSSSSDDKSLDLSFSEDGRSGTFVIGNDSFPASLLDLPCVVESYKTYDDSCLIKTADIGQMIMVREPGDAAPEVIEYRHGLTPPMRDARKRRFRREPDLNPEFVSRVEKDLLKIMAGGTADHVDILTFV